MLKSPSTKPTLTCPLCDSAEVIDYHTDKIRHYLCCEQCELVFVPKEYHLSEADEKGVYDQHQNNSEDAGYRLFLSRLIEPLLDSIAPNSRGLDFGSGPGPTLSLMLSEQGHEMTIYDPFYAPNFSALDSTYDFITTTEVVEHLSAPGEELQRLWRLLRPGGWLGVMTKLVIDQAAFSRWHYKNDPTHVCFFSKTSFNYLANSWHTRAKYYGSDVILLQKPAQG